MRVMPACPEPERDARHVPARRRLQRPPELAETFDRVGDGYDARSGYPTAVFDTLSRRCGLGPGARVLEIGPGTGQATVPMLDRGAAVTAIEAGASLARRRGERTVGRGHRDRRPARILLRQPLPSDPGVLAPRCQCRHSGEGSLDAIDQFDKLRLVASDGSTIVAVFELSFSIPDGDHTRFAAYGVSLDERTDVRFGPCVRDDERGSGLASRLLAETTRIALREGRSRLILWGGVQPDNRRARRFYEREGFSEVGRTPAIIDMVRPI